MSLSTIVADVGDVVDDLKPLIDIGFEIHDRRSGKKGRVKSGGVKAVGTMEPAVSPPPKLQEPESPTKKKERMGLATIIIGALAIGVAVTVLPMVLRRRS